MFQVASDIAEEMYEQFIEQIEGLKDAESKLRKVVWTALKLHDLQPSYYKILLNECRSNIDFFSSDSYRNFVRLSKLMLEILYQGVNDGKFRDDISIPLIQDFITGALEFTVLSHLTMGEIENSLIDYDDIMNLILSMISEKEKPAQKDKKERILSAAEEIFANKGFLSATISDIAKQAEVAHGTIYEYFKNKEDLLHLVLEEGLNKGCLGTLPHLFHQITPLERLERFIRNHFSVILADRRFLKLYITHVLFNPLFQQSKACKGHRRYIQEFEKIIDDGKTEGSFRSDINTRVFRNTFLGITNHLATNWFFPVSGKIHDKMMEIDQVVELYISAIRP